MLDSKIVGYVIKNTREKKGLSQEVVSGLADIGRTHLSAIERGERKPTLETFFKISDALDMNASVLMQHIECELKNDYFDCMPKDKQKVKTIAKQPYCNRP